MHRPASARLLFVLACATGMRPAPAQPLPPLDEYQVRAFDVADGLLAGDVTGLAQTADGYLYVAGGRGLARFDGHGFHPVALHGFRSSFVRSLHAAGRARLWVVSRANDLGYLEGARFHALPAPPIPLRNLSATADGTLWSDAPDGLVRITPAAADPFARFTAAHGLPSGTIAGVVDLADGQRVVVSAHRLARVETDPARSGGLRFVPFGPRYRRLVALRADTNGLWLALADHVLRYHDGRFTRHGPGHEPLHLGAFAWTDRGGAPLPDAFIRHVRLAAEDPLADGGSGGVPAHALLARDGTWWLSVRDRHDRRGDLLRRGAGPAQPMPLRPHLDFQRIQHLLEDHEGSLWVGTDRGLFQLSRRRVFALAARQGLTEGFTAPVLQTRDGAVWVGTWGGGLHRFADGRLLARYTIADGLPDDRVRALHEAADGALWVGTYRGLAAIRDGRVVLREDGLGEVRAFAETRGGASRSRIPTLWVGTEGRLLRRTRHGFVPYRPDRLGNRGIWALHAARDGALWVGAERGLFRLAGGTLRAFGAADGLRGPFVTSIHEEGDGTLWFGTYEHGLHRYRDGRFAALTTREGLHHDGVWRMLDDGHGGVWMSSDQGIFRVDHARLHAVADAVARGERVPPPLAPVVFTEAEGMPNRESNRASPGGWRLADGRLVFNNVAGIVVIDPRSAVAAPPPPHAVIQRVVADGKPLPVPAADLPTLPPGTKHLAFDFAALSFIAPEQNHYRYRLDGYDDAWVQGGTQPRAAYTNLPPGRYLFRVQGASGASPWGGPGAVYPFVVRPFPWQTWWFRLLAAAAVGGLVVLAYRRRVTRLLEMERLRLRIASDLHDDVGSNLSSIALLSEMLRGRAHVDGLDRRQLDRLHQVAGETIGALRDVIWLIDPEHDDLAHLVGRMRGVTGDLLNGTACAFDVDEPVAARPLGAAFMRNVLLIYKEALHNVARHARARRVAIRVVDAQGVFVLHVEDDGVGFAEAAVRPGRGLANMRRRARQSGGRLEIARLPCGGTRVTFSARMA